MYKEKDFDEAYDLTRDIIYFIKSIQEDSNLSYNIFKCLNDMGFELNSLSDAENLTWNITRRDILACHFALGFPKVYNPSAYEFFDLFNFAWYKRDEWILHSEYHDFMLNANAITQYCKNMFDSCIKIAQDDCEKPLFYNILCHVDDYESDKYIEILKDIANYISNKNTYVTIGGKKWLDELNNNPKAFSGINQKQEYNLTNDEVYVDSVNHDYYTLIDKVTDEILSFIRNELFNSTSVLKVVRKHPILGQAVTDIDNYKVFIRLSTTKDICECYKKLGHSINLATIEGKVLLMFLLKDCGNNTDFDHFNTICNRNVTDIEVQNLRNSLVKLLHKAYEIEKYVEDDFEMPYFLRQASQDFYKKYMVLIYRCASVIAKADGTISEVESQWLSQLIKQEGISEDETQKAIQSNNEIESAINPMAELESLIGLDSVKKDVISLANFIKMKQMREAKGMKAPNISYHCVFTGNPGTGKTTVARILASIFKELGILKSGHLIETDRSGLVAEYVGQTAIKTNNIIDSALDGVLFIDEAYSLIGGQNDFGKEAIATLLKRMEDDRDRLIVILAGYSHEMEEFINSNPGLRSRFSRYIFFPDYTSSELFEIFQLNVNKNEYLMTKEASYFLKEKMDLIVSNKHKDFGNARFVRNYFEQVIEHQADRLSSELDLTAEMLSELTIDDINII